MIYPNLTFGLCCEINIETKLLSLNYVNDTNTYRHNLMMELYNRGWGPKRISTFLNMCGVNKPRTNTPYSRKDVGMSLFKLKKREVRKTDTQISVSPWEIWTIRLY